MRQQHSKPLAVSLGRPFEQMRQKPDNQEGNRHQQYSPKGELVVDVEEEGQVADQRNRIRQELVDGGQHGIFHLLGVIHRTSHRIATTFLGKVAQG